MPNLTSFAIKATIRLTDTYSVFVPSKSTVKIKLAVLDTPRPPKRIN
jgi:hypothetical protein